MNLFDEFKQNMTRRYFFAKGSHVLGTAALGSLLGTGGAGGHAKAGVRGRVEQGEQPATTHRAAKAKHVIDLHGVGGPQQLDPYDSNPVMRERFDKDLPDSVRMGQRVTTMTSGQK